MVYRIPYERLDNLIVIAMKKGNHIRAKYEIVSPDDMVYEVTFTDYVKSQVHLNIVSNVFNRNGSPYWNVYRSLNGANVSKDDYKCVLKLFYSDMRDFLIYNDSNIRLKVLVDYCPFKSTSASYYYCDVMNSLQNLIEEAKSSFDASVHAFAEDPIYKIFKYCDDANLFNDKKDSYTTAAILESVLGRSWDGQNDEQGIYKINIEGGFYESRA